MAFWGCDSSVNSSTAPTVQKSDLNQSPHASTKLSWNTIYFYRSAFPEFRERSTWIAETEPDELAEAADLARKRNLKIKDMGLSVLSGDVLAAIYYGAGFGRTETGEPKILFWASPIGDPTDAPIANHLERTMRSLPKLSSDKTFELGEIESIGFDLDDPAKAIFQEMSLYNAAGSVKTAQAQSQARVVASATALVFRESDSSVLFINGIKWNHPLYKDGYTEFHLHVSQKTGAIINDSYAYTNFPIEPGQFNQYATLAKTAIDAVVLAKQLMAK